VTNLLFANGYTTQETAGTRFRAPDHSHSRVPFRNSFPNRENYEKLPRDLSPIEHPENTSKSADAPS
jgi:hypothetical protein